MAMRYEDRVKPIDPCTKCLLTEIDGRVDQDLFTLVLDEGGLA